MKVTKHNFCEKCGFEFKKEDLPTEYIAYSIDEFLKFTCPRCGFLWEEKLEDLEETDKLRKHICKEDGKFYFYDELDVERYGPYNTEAEALKKLQL